MSYKAKMKTTTNSGVLTFASSFEKWKTDFTTRLHGTDSWLTQETVKLLSLTNGKHLVPDAEFDSASLTDQARLYCEKLSDFDTAHNLVGTAVAATVSAFGHANKSSIKGLRTGSHILDDSREKTCIRKPKNAQERNANGLNLWPFVAKASAKQSGCWSGMFC